MGEAEEWWRESIAEKATATQLEAIGQWKQCYFHAGQCIEFGLKALYLRRNQLAVMPIECRGAKWHSVKLIASQCKIEADLGGLKTDKLLHANWLTVKDWDSNKRFPPTKISRADATDLMLAAFHHEKGVFLWLEKIYLRS